MDWLGLIVSFIGGLASGWTLKFVVDARRTTTSTSSHRGTVTQTGNSVGGDIAGGDIRKGTE